MNAPHKHADILRAIADGKKIECRIYQSKRVGNWREANLQDVCNNPGDMEYRIAPETVTVNGVECPKPNQESKCYWVTIARTNGHRETYRFDTESDARTVFDALCKPFKDGV